MTSQNKIALIKQGKPLKLMDFIVMGLVLVIAMVLIFGFLYGKKGDYLSVRYDGEEAFYSLFEDRIIEVGDHLIVTIKDGYAFVSHSDCKNHDCMDYGGKIRYIGQKIVCLPNKVVLTVVATKLVDPGWIST